jgi:hypothetical protein
MRLLGIIYFRLPEMKSEAHLIMMLGRAIALGIEK